MILTTICNEPWIDKHLVRWLRYAKKYSGCKLGLIYTGRLGALDGVYRDFDKVVDFPADADCRDWYNTVRMGATNLFGEDVLYCDCDCDIMGDMSHLKGEIPDKELLFCMSPAYHDDWVKIVYDRYRGQELWEANNGLLVLRKDWTKEYEEAFKIAKGSPRIVGTIAFNIMLREGGETAAELPYKYSVIWHDYKFMAEQLPVSIQYCNSHGQAKRVALEEEWRMWNVR